MPEMLTPVSLEDLLPYLKKLPEYLFQLKLRVRTNFLPTFAEKTNW